jgi:hypothetical protein
VDGGCGECRYDRPEGDRLMANTTWNPSDKAAGITLTGSNLIATGGGANQTVRAVDKQVTGKFYWEITATTFTNAGNSLGFCWSSYSLSTTVWSGGVTGSVAVTRGGAIGADGVNSGVSIGTITSGTVVCIAVDFGARCAWFRLGAAGNWNNNASYNPATGTGGIAFTSVGQGVAAFPAVSFNASGEQVTANFGDTAFTGAVPSGFTSGFTAGVTSSTNALATQSALEQWTRANPDAQVTQAALEMWGSVPLLQRFKYWTGSTWARKPAKVWTGSVWIEKSAKVWNGSTWS